MKKILLFSLPLLIMLIITACTDKAGNQPVVTERIQYDVSIKSPDPDFDWWVQNIEGSKREGFVKNILDVATKGKVKTYDCLSYRLLSPDELKGMLRKVDTVAIERSVPPYDLMDTVLVREIQVKDISKVRFLEEWNMDPVSLAFSKKVVGLCPLAEAYSETGELKGYKPLFWVFFDEAYPGRLK